MTLNIDELKKKIIYRSSYRGTKEMDKLLGAFTKKYIESLNIKDLKDLEEFLDIDDANLYNFYNGLDCDIKFKDKYIYSLFKDFKYNVD
jgi:antitoxin CptB